MKIAILHPSYDGSSSPFKDHDPVCDPARFLPEVNCENFQLRKETSVRQVIELSRRGFDAVINLCDGAWDEDRAGLEVVQALERVGIPFTGAGSDFYDPSRQSMKMAAVSAGVEVPAYVMAREKSDIDRAIADLRFPLIVKHPHGYSSVGMTPDSRVVDAEGLCRETWRTIEAFGAALIEEFIEGREFTVLVTEPRDDEDLPWALTPIEFVFPPGETFKHFDLKWVRFGEMSTQLVHDRDLAIRLQEAAALTFAAMSGSGYGRCDFRMNAAGEIFLLEINPNCGIFYPEGAFGSSDFILANDPAGHRGFLDHLLACAIRRRERSLRPWEVRHRRASGFGLFATHDLNPGENVVIYEESSYRLVSRRNVRRNWRGLKRRWFDRYAWPISENVFQLWSENPAEWRPINHSCDPNTWLEGLDLVARRAILSGEELTVDYATFCGESMTPFECHCGAVDCRGMISGTDYRRPEIAARFGDHVSDYVRAAALPGDGRFAAPYEIVRNVVGSGLVARRAWRIGEVVSPVSWGRRQPVPSRWTVQVGQAEHADPLPFELRYINHSCDPNVFFDIDRHELQAVRDIAPGDELTFFYPSTEWSMVETFNCCCSASNCVGHVSGAKGMPREEIARYRISSVIQHRLGLT